jgi:predicted transcriptional regulator
MLVKRGVFMIAEATLLKKIALKDARASLLITQRELARRAGLHYRVIGKAEGGRTIWRTSAYAIVYALNELRAEKGLDPLGIDDLDWKIE